MVSFILEMQKRALHLEFSVYTPVSNLEREVSKTNLYGG